MHLQRQFCTALLDASVPERWGGFYTFYFHVMMPRTTVSQSGNWQFLSYDERVVPWGWDHPCQYPRSYGHDIHHTIPMSPIQCVSSQSISVQWQYAHFPANTLFSSVIACSTGTSNAVRKSELASVSRDFQNMTVSGIFSGINEETWFWCKIWWAFWSGLMPAGVQHKNKTASEKIYC